MQYIGVKISKVFYCISEFPSTISFPMCSVIQLCPTLCNPVTVAHQAPLSMGLPRQDTIVGCHFLLQGIFLTQGLNCIGTQMKPFLSYSKYFILFYHYFYIWGIFQFFPIMKSMTLIFHHCVT